MPIPGPRPSLGLNNHPCNVEDLIRNQERIMQLLGSGTAGPQIVLAFTDEMVSEYRALGYVKMDGTENADTSKYTGANWMGRVLKLAANPGVAAAAENVGAGGDHDHGGATGSDGSHDHGGSTGTSSGVEVTHAQVAAALANHSRHKHYIEISGNDSDAQTAGTEDMNFPSVGGGTSGYQITSGNIANSETTGAQSSQPSLSSDGTVHTAETGGPIDLDHSHTISSDGSHTHTISSSGTHVHTSGIPISMSAVPMERPRTT